MRRSTADALLNHLSGTYGRRDQRVRRVTAGFKLGKERATLRLPYDDMLLDWLRKQFWSFVVDSSVQYGISTAMERLATEIESFRRTSVIDHLVNYTDRLPSGS